MPVRLLDFLSGLSGALDLMSPEVVGHHKRVAYLAARLSKALDASREERTELFMAAILHDVGGFTRQSRLAALSFETDGVRHAELGYRLMRTNPLLDSAAAIVRHHHTPHSRFGVLDEPGRKLFLAGVLNLADRVDVLALRQPRLDPAEILGHIRPRAGYQFDPLAVEALAALAGDPGFWAPLAEKDPTRALAADPDMFQERGMSRGQLMQASTAFSQIIDFRSRFTATHSRGVAETAVCLAEKAGMSGQDLVAMRLAGNLHDLGKLAVPSEIIDKPGPLDAEEMAVMQRHPELGEAILAGVPGLERVAAWASQHHEQLGGNGYPKGLAGEDISLGSRIMAVADVFTALREDRPYRAGLKNGQTLGILAEMTTHGALAPEIAALARQHLEEIDQRRQTAQAQAATEFRQFYTDVPAQ